jgi:hypothetical protein
MNQLDPLEEFLKALASLPEPVVPEPKEYRIYYNETGRITMLSMTNHPEGDYIVVDLETFENYTRYAGVKDKKLIPVAQNSGYQVQLSKGLLGFTVVAGHAGLLIEDESYQNTENYGYTNR